MGDDSVVVDTAPEHDSQPRRWGGAWLALIGVAAIVLFFAVTQGGEAPPVTTMAPLPSITVPPTIPQGRVVDRTLLWTNPMGLEDVTRLGDVVSFQDRYWLLASASEGIGAWTSLDGVAWEREAWVTSTGDWMVSDVAADESMIGLAASGWVGDEYRSGVFHSADGHTWELSISEDEAEPMPTWATLIEIDGEFLLTGWSESPPAVTHYPEPYRTLVRRGSVWVEDSGEGLLVWVLPNLQVGEIPRSELVAPPPLPFPSQYRVWRGPLDNLRLTPAGPPVEQITPLGDGTYLGVSHFGGEVMASADATEWEPFGVQMGDVWSIEPWQHGVAALSWSDAPSFWWPGASEAEHFLPETFESLVLSQLDTGSDVGLIVGYHERSAASGITPDVSGPIEGEDGTYRATGLFGDVEILSDDELVWRQSGAEASATLVDETLVFENAAGEAARIPLEAWLDVAVPTWMGVDTSGTGMLHTVDGSKWSTTEWSTILGDGYVYGPLIRATDDFVLVGDYPPLGEAPVAPIKVGFPLG